MKTYNVHVTWKADWKWKVNVFGAAQCVCDFVRYRWCFIGFWAQKSCRNTFEPKLSDRLIQPGLRFAHPKKSNGSRRKWPSYELQYWQRCTLCSCCCHHLSFCLVLQLDPNLRSPTLNPYSFSNTRFWLRRETICTKTESDWLMLAKLATSLM